MFKKLKEKNLKIQKEETNTGGKGEIIRNNPKNKNHLNKEIIQM